MGTSFEEGAGFAAWRPPSSPRSPRRAHTAPLKVIGLLNPTILFSPCELLPSTTKTQFLQQHLNGYTALPGHDHLPAARLLTALAP